MGRNKRSSGKNNFSLSLIIPCFNNASGLEKLFSTVEQLEKKWSAPFEIILVDDGSTDGTAERIKNHDYFEKLKSEQKAKLLVLPKHEGRGSALKQGVSEANGDYILTTDRALEIPVSQLSGWLERYPEYIRNNVILTAARNHPDGKRSSSSGFSNKIFQFFVRRWTSLDQADPLSGFSLYPAKIARYLFGTLRTDGTLAEIELLYRAELNKISVLELPVQRQAINEASQQTFVPGLPGRLVHLILLSVSLNWQYFIADPIRSLLPGGEPSFLSRGSIPIFRTLFVLLTVLLLFFMPYISMDFGITGDERIQYFYGEHIYDYFATWGADDVAQDCCPEAQANSQILHYYGGFFDLFTSIVVHWFGFDDPFVVRHALNAFFGFLAILFASLIALLFGGYPAALLTMSILTLTPRFFAHSMNNPKDIPFAAAYIIGVYFMFKVIRRLPKPKTSDIVWLIVGIALSISVRIGGLLLIAYFGLFLLTEIVFNKRLRSNISRDVYSYVKVGAVVVLFGYFGGLIFWPYAHADLLNNPFIALDKMEQFSLAIRLLFQGEFIDSYSIPWYYVFHYIWITLPLVFLAGLFASPYLFVKNKKTWWRIALLFFVAIFPLLYVVYKDSPLYDGMRHFLFVIPAMASLAGLAWTAGLENLRGKGPRIAGGLVCAALLFLPLRWMANNHPNEVVYFNEIVGGVDGAYGEYELDYWQNSGKGAVEWIIKNRKLPDTVRIVTNINPFAIRKYFKEFDAGAVDVKVQYAKYSSEDQWMKSGNKRFTNWDFALFYNRYIDVNELEDYWPPRHSIYAEKADDVPLTVVLERISKADIAGYRAVQNQRWGFAAEKLNEYVRADPNSGLVWYYLGLAHFNLKQYEPAASALERSLELRPEGVQAGVFGLLGKAYLSLGQIQKVLNWSNRILQDKQIELQEVENEIRGVERIDPTDFYHYLDLLQILTDVSGVQVQAFRQNGQMQQAARAGKMNQQFRKAYQRARKQVRR